MKPQDILVLLKILILKDQKWRQIDLASDLGLSQTEINYSLNRLAKAGLLNSAKRTPLKQALAEFLMHGFKYVFPPERGSVSRGIVTAHSHPSLARKLTQAESSLVVWPDAEGDSRGETLEPIYPSVPLAAKKDPVLYEWLALLDALRIGSARVQKLAADRIVKMLEEFP